MKKALWALLVLSAAALSGFGACGNSTEAQHRHLTKQFLACVPDSVGDSHRDEIKGLLETFWARADMGEVYETDVAKIESKMHVYIDRGRINADTLAHFMALVGYSSYRKDPRYNLPEKIVDHPTLNPDAAIVMFGADSTGPRARIYYRVPGPDSTADTTAGDSTGADTKKAPSK
jgi:hypothetical protein